MDISVKWKCGEKWVEFDINDILHLSRNHFINLFSRNIPMIAKSGQTIISNDKLTRQAYHKKREFTVIALDKLIGSELPLAEVGLI